MDNNNHKENNNQTKNDVKRLNSFCNLTLSLSSFFTIIQSLTDFKVSKFAISGFFIGLLLSSVILKSYLENYDHFFSKKVLAFFKCLLFLGPVISLSLLNDPVQRIMRVDPHEHGATAINNALKNFSLDKKNSLLLSIGFFIIATCLFGFAVKLIFNEKFKNSYLFIFIIILLSIIGIYSPIGFIIIIVLFAFWIAIELIYVIEKTFNCITNFFKKSK